MLASVAAKWMPRDFVEATQTGGIFTIIAYVIMLIIFICEIGSFMSSSYTTLMLLDPHDTDVLQINFDVDMYDIECRNLKVLIYAQNNEEKISALSQDFWLRSVDQKGHVYGMAIQPKALTEEEERGEAAHQQEMEKVRAEDGQKELDSDWLDSHDGFQHKSFDHVIQAHDFTLINFFASWCGHCREFAPTWERLAKRINGEDGMAPQAFPDRDGQNRQVRMIKLNCVDFKATCQEKGIDAYPTIRLYKADGSFSVFEGHRDEVDLTKWLERTVKMKSYGWAAHHQAFERGCNAKGRMQVPRVPGHLELMAGGGDQNLNARMTNVSHLVKHLSFSDPSDGRYHRKGWSGLPHSVLKHVSPLDGKSFVTENFHEAWVHDIKVVGTVSQKGKTAYQMSHQRRLSRVKDNEVPQTQFHYDIEPFSILVQRADKRWYDFFTSLLAMLGGSFVVMRLASGASLSLLAQLKSLLPRAGVARGGGLNINPD